MDKYVYQDSKNIYVVSDADTYGDAQKSVEDYRSRNDVGEGEVKHVASASGQAQVLAVSKDYLQE